MSIFWTLLLLLFSVQWVSADFAVDSKTIAGSYEVIWTDICDRLCANDDVKNSCQKINHYNNSNLPKKWSSVSQQNKKN